MPYRAWLLAVVLVALAATAIAPYDRRDWTLEHLPTLGVLAFLVWQERRPGGRPLSDASYALLAIMMLLHVLGAWYLYSRVPYVQWYESLVGTWPWPSERNHYDRFVHLCFGLLVLPAFAELAEREITRTRGQAVFVGVLFVAICSKIYELAEWGVAITLSPEQAEAYNGQQGDPFDAQKDMALALAGSLVSGALYAALRGRGPTAPGITGGAP